MSSLNPFAKKKDKEDSQTPEPGKAAETKKEDKKDPEDKNPD